MRRKFTHIAGMIGADMPGIAGDEDFIGVSVAHLILKANGAAFDFGREALNDDIMSITGGACVAHIDFGDDQVIAGCFKIGITVILGFEPISSSDLEPYYIAGMMYHRHGVSFGIPNINAGFVTIHR